MFRQFLMGIMGLSIVLTANDCCYDSVNNVWFEIEYLYWKIQDAPKIIPLVEESFLNDSSSRIVLGDQRITSKWRSGARFTLGFWFDDVQCYGVEANYFFLGEATAKKKVFSDGLLGSPFLAFPFIDSESGADASLNIAFPGSYSGLANLRVSNQLNGAELNGISHFYCCNGWDIDLLGGFRYLNFSEHLRFHTNSPYINASLANIYFTNDKFILDSNFYGAQIGANFNYNCSDLLFNFRAKIAFGAIMQSSKVHGEFVLNDFTDFVTVQRYESGFLAYPSNSGHRKKTRFSVIPEVNLNIGYQISDGFSLLVGYNFLYVTNVLRASKQLSNKINPTQSALLEFTPTPVLVGEGEPKGHLRSSSLWVQGLNVGFEFQF